ncbi:non-ribosomal peptide synthetase [Streptomyces sclerotialus]|uniref:non-ribosomal peptide synthetase n=1 Tax=Streptomyces sclerotialus TaxID=1957 RepID=UPI0006901DC6
MDVQALHVCELQRFRGRAVPYPADRSVAGLVEAAAIRHPEAPAVEYGNQVLTYRRLMTGVVSLAGRLAASGVRRGALVPLVMRNGPELPLAMLAVVKAGAAFVPLAEQWPEPRLRTMVSACAPEVVLLSPGGPEGVCDGVPSLTVDVLRPGAGPEGPAHPPVGPEDLAYGFYTSGSTGTPKCALNLHRGLVNRLHHMSRRFLDPHERPIVLQNSRHTFDSSLWQLLWPLSCGGRVVIPERQGLLDLPATVAAVERHQVTMTDFVPTILNSLVELLRSRPDLVPRLASLRTLLVGGEEINHGSVRALQEMLPGLRITNTYGPTEAAIGMVFHDVARDDSAPLPIGRPIDNTWAAVLDGELRPAAPGTVGEIWIGGDCLGAGYLGDPERTARAFVPNPFPQLPGPLMYRTGDRGHYGADDLLYFDGRADQQVKIGGVRVELSEVEQALAAHPQVREAKVVVHEHGGRSHLAAFVTAHSGPSANGFPAAGALTAAELKRHVRTLLPGELTPRRFTVLESMPVNGNGKADRRALADLLDATARATAPAAVPARNATERTLLELWATVLPAPVSSPQDDFFESGGDSLCALQLALAITERFGTAFSVGDVVAMSTVDAQAAHLGAATAGHGRTAAPPQRPLAPSDFPADLHLPADIDVTAAHAPSPVVERVLLTGATGFIGAQLLHDVLRRTGATVHCLVRADSPQAALRRLTAHLQRYRLWSDETAGRIDAVPGDLTRPWLGLTPADRRRLSEDVDTVVHAGALVNLVRGYAAHRGTNVTGTVELLRLAATARPKHVHFVSTLSACPGQVREAVTPAAGEVAPSLVPEARFDGSEPPGTGYGQSKWVAERLVQEAADRGLTVAVHRLGEVMPSARTGVPNAGACIELLVRACLRTGTYVTGDVSVDYTPVDHVGALLLTALTDHRDGYFHLLRPHGLALDELLGAFGHAFGLHKATYEEFWHLLHAASMDDPRDGDLARALAVLPVPSNGHEDVPGQGLAELFHDSTALFSTDRATELAERAGLRTAPVGPAEIELYVAHHRERFR